MTYPELLFIMTDDSNPIATKSKLAKPTYKKEAEESSPTRVLDHVYDRYLHLDEKQEAKLRIQE